MKTIKSIFTVGLIMLSVTIFAQELKVNVKKSTLKWHGEKVTGEHFGNINLKEGKLNWMDNKITSGEFIIDMQSITNTDLEDPDYNAKLVGHLKSDDFFGVEKYPEARLLIKSCSNFVNNKAAVTADLTIKGITHPVEFTAVKSGDSFTAKITVDRAKYDVRYGSGSFFDNLGDKTIYDNFELTVSIVTTK